LINYLHRLEIIVNERREQIVHAHGNSATLYVEMLAAKRGGAAVRIPHSHNTTCKMKLADKLLRKPFQKSFTHAAACGDAAGKWLFGDAAFLVLNNAVPAEHFHFDARKREETRDALKIPRDALTVCHVGSFNEQKNQAFLVEAFAELLKVRSNARLLLVGDGKLKNDCEQRAKTLHVSDKVIFAGVMDDVAGVLCAADIFALPSLHEGLPLTLIEAQCAGLDCVASDNVTREAALTELVSFCGIADAGKFAKALLKMPAKDRETASEDAIERVRKAGYDVSANAGTLSKWYETLATGAKT
jgi:glycosyltransferase involved in cell wall biosynthesis